VAGTVVCRVETAILVHEFRRIGSRPVESLTAQELWLRAREAIRRAGLAQVDEIEALCARAIALDPGHGRALARYERCLHLDPQSPWRTYVWPGMTGCLIAALAHSGRIAEADAHYRRSAEARGFQKFRN
jgi:hypothetical protein